jgi:uncharacterized protein
MTALEELRASLPELRQRLRPRHIILFGSQARGTATEASDVDLILVSEEFVGVPWPQRHKPFFAILWRHRSVDLICLTPEEFERLRQWAGVIATACEEGVWLPETA